MSAAFSKCAFDLRDPAECATPCNGSGYAGLLDSDGQPNPAWEAFAGFLAG